MAMTLTGSRLTTARPSPPPADQQVPEEVQDLLKDTGEWDALDAIYEQLHQVQATLHRVRKALRVHGVKSWYTRPYPDQPPRLPVEVFVSVDKKYLYGSVGHHHQSSRQVVASCGRQHQPP